MKRKRRLPPVADDDQLGAIRTLLRNGWVAEDIWRVLRISESTYYRRLRELARMESEAHDLVPAGAVA